MWVLVWLEPVVAAAAGGGSSGSDDPGSNAHASEVLLVVSVPLVSMLVPDVSVVVPVLWGMEGKDGAG